VVLLLLLLMDLCLQLILFGLDFLA